MNEAGLLHCNHAMASSRLQVTRCSLALSFFVNKPLSSSSFQLLPLTTLSHLIFSNSLPSLLTFHTYSLFLFHISNLFFNKMAFVAPVWTAATMIPLPSVKEKIAEAAKKRALYYFGQMTQFIGPKDEKQFVNCPAFDHMDPKMQLLAVTAGESGSALPEVNTTLSRFGKGELPRFTWKDPGNGTNSFAFVVEDLDARMDSHMHHGIFYNIPPDRLTIDSKDTISLEGSNLNRLTSSSLNYISTRHKNEPYVVPAPTLGHGVHRYQFTIIALIDLFIGFERPYKVTVNEFKECIKYSVVSYGQWVGMSQGSRPNTW